MKLLLTLLILLIAPPANAPVYDSLGQVRAKLAHQYHGIYISCHDNSGDWFERDGVKCRLYTQGCEAYINSKLKGRI